MHLGTFQGALWELGLCTPGSTPGHQQGFGPPRQGGVKGLIQGHAAAKEEERTWEPKSLGSDQGAAFQVGKTETGPKNFNKSDTAFA